MYCMSTSRNKNCHLAKWDPEKDAAADGGDASSRWAETVQHLRRNINSGSHYALHRILVIAIGDLFTSQCCDRVKERCASGGIDAKEQPDKERKTEGESDRVG